MMADFMKKELLFRVELLLISFIRSMGREAQFGDSELEPIAFDVLPRVKHWDSSINETSTTWHNCRMSYMFSKGRCDFLIAPSVNVQFKWAYKGAP